MRSFGRCCLLVLGLAVLTLAGCQKGDARSEGQLRIAVIPKGTTHEFWKSVHYGAEKAAQELGNVEIFYKGPLQENDRQGQIGVVRDFITKRVDGICLAPLDSRALVEYVAEAAEEGIPVVIFDSGLADESHVATYVATDNFHGGQLAARTLVEAMGGQGDVILFRYHEGSESTEQREEGFLKTLKEDFPNVNVLSENQYAGTTTKSSQEKAMQILGKYKDQVDGVFAVCEPNADGVLLALDELELAGKVKFVAFDPNAALVTGLGTGKVHGIVLQDPVKMGYEAVMAMAKHLKKEPWEKRIITGEHVATPANRQTEEMQALLAPPKFTE